MRLRKSALAVFLVTLLAMLGMDVWAEESFPIEAGEALSMKMRDDIEKSYDNSTSQDMTRYQDEKRTLGQAFLDADVADRIIASGMDEDIVWVIDGSGKLTVEGTGDLSEYRGYMCDDFAWRPYSEQITSAEININGMTDASFLFYGCSNMANIDLRGFDTSNVISMRCMFEGCSGLTSLDVGGFDTSNVIDMFSMFEGCSGLTSLDVSGFDTGNVTVMGNMFNGCSGLTSLDVSKFNTGNVTSMNGIFQGCSGLASLDASGFDTSNVADMSRMFRGCSSLMSLDVSRFDTSNVKYMSYMFGRCSGLTSLDVSGFNTSNVTHMGGIFFDCSSLKSLDVGGFDTSNVIYMFNMFGGCSGLTSLDVSNFVTSNVTDMGMSYSGGMFENCSGLVSLDLSSFDTSNVISMAKMFSGCSGLTGLDISSFDTDNVTDMMYMFSGCSGLRSLDVSGFNLKNVTYAVDMFYGCDNLTTLYSPYTVRIPVLLPDVPNTMWHLQDGTEVTELSQNISYSVTLIRSDATPAPTSAPTPAPTSVPTPAPTSVLTPTHIPVNPPYGESVQKVQNFVFRMYTIALGREAEEAGLNDWTNRLLTHEIDGAGIANGFIMSDEFKNRNLSNETYVDTLYRTFFDREADQGGRATWLAELAAGKSRSYVLSGFVNSAEFDNLCDAYGIARGTMREDGSPVNAGIRQFVERCYTKVLGREGEKAGVEDWTNRITTGQMSAEDVAKSFFFSDEYTYKNTDNETFVETLYQTFMDRASDPAGKSDWVGRLSRGTSRQEVLEGFSRSEEFSKILRSYGL